MSANDAPKSPLGLSSLGGDFVVTESQFTLSASLQRVCRRDPDRCLIIFGCNQATFTFSITTNPNGNPSTIMQLTTNGNLVRLTSRNDPGLIWSDIWATGNAMVTLNVIEVFYRPQR